ncbi:MAG: flagellar biosynthesis anti-sigma factor FlgM [Lachnospiraceae bacterium]|nr:flagellar biosynthesis anti-sigma factor FlgM [Lachnospiraceae bacterium]
MRVEAFNSIAQVYKPNKTTGKNDVTKVSAMKRDDVQISSFGKEIQVAKQAVADASDIREDLVAEMKQKYSGDFQVDTGDFADVLLAKFNSLS